MIEDKTCTCYGTMPACVYCSGEPEPEPLPPPPAVKTSRAPATPPWRTSYRSGILWLSVATVSSALLVVCVAKQLSAAREPAPTNVGVGTLSCRGSLPETRTVGGKPTYSCPFGGAFSCTATDCGVYSWEYRPERRHWSWVKTGDTFPVAPRMDHFFSEGGP